MVEDWFKEFYESSTFNTCKHQPLPNMKGAEPLRIFMRKDGSPVAVHRPTTTPAHWQEKVCSEIQRDICLGVHEQAPHNTPVTWSSRMHFVVKKSREPRPVNYSSCRQTHYMELPFSQARGIPPNTYRYISYAWNGYHSVQLDSRDHHVTTH